MNLTDHLNRLKQEHTFILKRACALEKAILSTQKLIDDAKHYTGSTELESVSLKKTNNRS